MLIFRDQTMSREDHKRFGRRFGPLHVHPYHLKDTLPEHALGQAETGPARDPEILVVKADQASRFVAGEEWHTDVSCDAEPPMGSMLYITQTPESGGGDTCFSSTIRAFEALSPAMQAFLRDAERHPRRRQALHRRLRPGRAGRRLAEIEPPGRGAPPRQRAPVPLRQPRLHHPDQRAATARRATRCWSSCGATSSSTLEFQCRVRWAPNTLVFWDNRATQHHAVWDYYPFSRYGERVSIVGSRPGRRLAGRQGAAL